MSEETGEPLELQSRFADPEATTTVDLGACRCPGTPHARDTAEIRAEIGAGELGSASTAAYKVNSDGIQSFDGVAGDDSVAARFTLSWTLLGRGGKPVPITARNISLLDDATRSPLLEALLLVKTGPSTLPNASGARSPGSPPASASPNRATRRRR